MVDRDQAVKALVRAKDKDRDKAEVTDKAATAVAERRAVTPIIRSMKPNVAPELLHVPLGVKFATPNGKPKLLQP